MSYTTCDGVFMASTRINSTRIWDAIIKNPTEVVGRLGDMEHYRDILERDLSGSGHNCDSYCLYWMTDRTPHESLPLVRGGQRQYFRVVRGPVSMWYSQHSTSNPLGTEADAVILEHNKFGPVFESDSQ